MSDAAAKTNSPGGAPEAATVDLTDDGLLGAIVRLNLLVTDVLEDITGRAGVTLADYLVLGVVRRSPEGRSAPTAIAAVLGRTTGGMSLTLDRLEAAGLIRRSPDVTDGRRVVVELTPTGRRLAVSVNRSLHKWEASLRLPMPTRRATVVLDAISEAVRAHPA